MAKYVEGFVLPVPKKNLVAYKKIAKVIGKVCREHGALEYIESVSDNIKKGKVTSFPRAVKLKAGETVIFSFAKYKSRAHRDSVHKKVMKDPRITKLMNPKKMPFDGMRMFWGGFKVFLALK